MVNVVCGDAAGSVVSGRWSRGLCRAEMACIFDGVLSAFALDRGVFRRFMIRLQTLAFARLGVLVYLSSVMARQRFIKHTLILWSTPPFGGSLGSSLGHNDEIEVGRDMDKCMWLLYVGN